MLMAMGARGVDRASRGATAGTAGTALAALAALVLLVIACRSEDAAPPVSADAAAPEAGDDAAAEAETGPVKGCPGSAPASYPWQPPVAADLAACTVSDLSNLAAAILN
jgi:hypothetical protein